MGYHNITNLYKTNKYRKEKKKNTPKYWGLFAYMGEFGAGKTLSAVKHTLDIIKDRPDSLLITNVKILGVKNQIFFRNAEELTKILKEKLTEKPNGSTIIFIDELHIVLSDLFSSSNPIFLTYLSQLRHLGIIIIGTCQLYNRCPKMVRDYLRLSGQIIFCHKLIQGLTLNRFVDMTTAEETSTGKLNFKLKRIDWYFHTIELYESYDTHGLITQVQGLIKYDSNKIDNSIATVTEPPSVAVVTIANNERSK